MIHTLPTLYHRTSKNKVIQWNIDVIERDDRVFIVTRFGQRGGKIQVLEKEVKKGKNLGKANATTPWTQAVSDATSLWTKRLDADYFQEIPPVGYVSERPMLAHPFQERKHDIEWPAYGQPKLEGVRCIAHRVARDKMRYYSRNLNDFKFLHHLDRDYFDVLEVGEKADGEIFNPRFSFQDITRFLKNPDFDHAQLSHHVYDFPTYPAGFSERYSVLRDRFSDADCRSGLIHIELVDLVPLYEEKDVYEWHNTFVHEGYEGIMIRNRRGEYDYGNRSINLQKYKTFMDAEFLVVDIEQGSGRDDDIGNPVCETKDGKRFGAPSTGDRWLRQDYLNNPEKYIGKLMTVQFQRYTDEGIPYLPKAIGLRDYE